MGAPYIYDVSRLRVNFKFYTDIKFGRRRKRRNAHKTFVGKPEGTKHSLRRKNRSNYNIKVNLKEMCGGGVN